VTLLWVALVGYGILMFLVSPRAADAKGFFFGYDAQGRQTGFWLLTGSTFITWIFAKSVTNAANLGATYGIVGGLAYATYYLSIPVAGIVIVSIRRRHGARSLSEFLVSRYGPWSSPSGCSTRCGATRRWWAPTLVRKTRPLITPPPSSLLPSPSCIV